MAFQTAVLGYGENRFFDSGRFFSLASLLAGSDYPARFELLAYRIGFQLLPYLYDDPAMLSLFFC